MDHVFADKAHTIPEVMDKIVHTINMVTPAMLSRVHEEIVNRLYLCISRGAVIFRTMSCKIIVNFCSNLLYYLIHTTYLKIN